MTRTNWSAQSQRLWDYLASKPNEDIPQPELNRAAAGAGGLYVNSFTKRLSECRKRAQAAGGDVIKSRDEWVKLPDGSKRRETAYRYIPELDHAYNCATNAPEFAACYGCTCGVRL